MKNKKFSKLSKQLSITLVACMLFQNSQVGFFSASRAFAATSLRHKTVGNDVMLGGNYIEVGISKSGSFGTESPAPSGFHSSYNGSYQRFKGVGLRVDGDGFDTGKEPTTGDFFLPGTPEESFTIGYKVGSNEADPIKYTNAERVGETDIPTITTDTSSNDILSALTSGTTIDGNLAVQQNISFKVNNKYFKNTITYTNKGTSTLYDVRYMRSFDPDQDGAIHGIVKTFNCVLENFPQDSRAIVRAAGEITKEPVFFISTDNRARASTFGFTNRDPYIEDVYNEDGSKLKKPEVLEDQAIAITFALGNLEPGQSTTFEYYTSLDPDYNAGLEDIMNSLGIKINNGDGITDSLDVVLNLNGQYVSQMRFSNDNSTWSSWEPYASTKLWTLTDGNGTKTVYVQFQDSKGNISSLSSSIVYTKPDNTSPIISVLGNPTDWTNTDVTLTVNASDIDSGLNTSGAYSFDGGLSWTTENSKSFSENETVNIKVRDNSGNISSQEVVIDKIDKTLPIITSVTGNPSDWTTSDVILTVNATDIGSGLDTKAYSFDDGITWQPDNIKIYSENTSNIIVKVKDSVGNIATYDAIDITKIDKTAPNTAVIENRDKYTENNWYNKAQTITGSFTATAGCDEKLQYKVNDGAWTDGESVAINAEGKYDVSFRVIDSLDRTSEAQAVKVNVDNTNPTDAKITVKDREFNSLLNKITFGIFFKETVNVNISADGNISGINKIEYQKVSNESDYSDDGDWISGTSFNVDPDEKFVIYAKVTDNAGNYVVVNSDGIVVDATKPSLALTADNCDWINNNVSVKVEVSDELAGIKEVTYTTNETVPQTGTVDISNGFGTIILSNEGEYELTVTAKDNSLNEVKQIASIKIDRTIPKITGASESAIYLIGRVIRVTDDLGEISDITYKKDTDSEITFINGDLFEEVGIYTLIVKDKAGNSTTLSFEIKELPKVEDIVYTEDCKELIKSIRVEFDSHDDLPEPYKTNTDNEIKILEDKYSQLDKEVVDIKAETSLIKGKVDLLPSGIDGLLDLQKEIQDEYNKIASDTSTLTDEQKLALEKEAEYLKDKLDIMEALQNELDSINREISSIDTKVDGLISKEDKIKEILDEIYKLTKEQQNILKSKIDLLNSLVDKNKILKEDVEEVKNMINKLPSAEKVTRQNFDLLISVYNSYNKLTNEQKSLVGENLAKYLKDCLNALSKLMLHDENTDLTVTGIDGTTLDLTVYLVVTPFKADNTKFVNTAEIIKKAATTIPKIKNKELVALYDISLLKDKVKIQPNGNVEVKIKVPENLIKRSGLDIVHIGDNGTVTAMNAVVKDGYLVFITNHFSDYGIVADPIASNTTVNVIPQTGSVVDYNLLLLGGVLLVLGGVVIRRRQRRKV